MEEDGFILVSKRKAAKVRKMKNLEISLERDDEGDVESPCKKVLFFKDVLACQKDISEFLREVKQELGRESSPLQRSPSIVCYGLGKVSSCRIAQIQFSFLLLLRDHLKAHVEAYDPAFATADKKLLNDFHIRVIHVNEKAKRIVKDDKTVFYMPHCDFFLYNNLLWANWSEVKLKNLVLIGNSFKKTVQDHISRNFSAKYKYISMAEKLSTEYAFPVLKDNFECFNNISLIVFSNCSQLVVDKCIWKVFPEPTYSDDELN